MSKRFLETTRGQVLGLLRREARTVEELAGELGLTDNAIRAHLATLDRDGLVRQEGVRRGPGAGKPAVVYQLAPDVEAILSRAYAPVLAALLEELTDRLPPEQTEALLLAVGRRLAAAVPRRGGTLEARAREGVAVLNELGGDASLEPDGAGFRVRGSGCPLSAAVARRPETCRAVQALLSDVIGVPVQECCEHGPRPRCCFLVPPSRSGFVTAE
ncbi:MAG: helix-turn-helix transcriptional regulator [Gemmatimonadales bacterium]